MTENSSTGETLRLTVFGARGSIPVHGARFREFGGATTCFLIEAGDQAVLIDAGTGIIAVDKEILTGREISILLTHPHIDHLAGLPFFAALSEQNRSITVYGAARGGQELGEQIDALYRPPYWPLNMTEYPADVKYQTLPYRSLSIGNLTIDPMEVPHPGGCTAYRIRRGDRTIVIATDAELPLDPQGPVQDGFDPGAFLSVRKGADLVLLDSQYTTEEYAGKQGYGHSTAECALAWKEAAEVRQLLLVHHDPGHDDAFLSAWEKRIGRTDVRFARTGAQIDL